MLLWLTTVPLTPAMRSVEVTIKTAQRGVYAVSAVIGSMREARRAGK